MNAVDAPLAALRGRVKRDELELGAAMRELAVAVKRSIAPAHWIRESPWVCMTGAVVIGFWWGSGYGRRRSNGWR